MRQGMPVCSVATALLALAGCGVGGPAYGPPPTDAVVVGMTNTFSFSPATVRIPAGGTLEWRNTSLVKHTVTDDPKLVGTSGAVSLPPRAAPFNSGNIRPGGIYRVTFTTPGTYNYVCLPHEDVFDMRGVVEVTP